MSRKLHIGGTTHADGWEIFNAVPGPYVDYHGNANDLSRFHDCTFESIYASHVVEHLDYVNELSLTLAEWWRVLVPGGKIFISVPDLDVLAGLVLNKEMLSIDQRFMVMRMIFGGHVDQYDYHLVGLNQEFLSEFLSGAGYVSIIRVNSLGQFMDTSEMIFAGVPISLNMIAERPV